MIVLVELDDMLLELLDDMLELDLDLVMLVMFDVPVDVELLGLLDDGPSDAGEQNTARLYDLQPRLRVKVW